MTREEREDMEREAERIRKFKGKVIIMRCECGHELETDMPFEKMEQHKCGVCGKKKWILTRNTGKRIAKDLTAPLEILGVEEVK